MNQQAKILPDGRGELINPFPRRNLEKDELGNIDIDSDIITDEWANWNKAHPDRIIEIKGQERMPTNKTVNIDDDPKHWDNWRYPPGSIVNVREIEKPKVPYPLGEDTEHNEELYRL